MEQRLSRPADGVDSDDTETMVRLGVAAARRGDGDEAEEWYRAAAEGGDVDGMDLLALVCEERGEWAEARHWYARAAARDDTLAMQGLARLGRRKGRLDETKRWYRKAADRGDTDAMVYLADLISSTEPPGGDDDTWYRRAAELGNPRALAVIGTRLQQQGKTDEAEQWLRRAVDTTDEPFFMVELGRLLEQRGAADEAESWYRRASTAGDTTAMAHLGATLMATDTGEAEQWCRKAAEAGRTSAMTDLALLLVHRGDTAEAEQWLERASAAGPVDVSHERWAALPALDDAELDRRERAAADHHRVLVVLGALARRHDDIDRAEHCFRRAAAAGDTQAMYEMGMLLTRWGSADSRAFARTPFRRRPKGSAAPVERAETWFVRAAEGGHADAMFSLSALHKGGQEGEMWWNRAVEAVKAANTPT